MTETKKLNQISKDDIGKQLQVDAEIINVMQTKGPTLFKITDGHGTFTVKAFIGAGKRAHPSFDVGHVARITFRVNEHNGTIEGEASGFDKIENADALKTQIETVREQKSRVDAVPFFVQSVVTDKLKDRFVKAATLIKKAIANNRPILIRHHNDCDGYCSGVALHRAILGLLEKQHGKKDATRYVTRSPCRAPFYHYEDSLRDISIAAGNLARFDEEPPLVIIADNGAGSEDLLGIQQGKIYGLDFIVVDHHPYGETDVISSEVLVNINPYLVGEDYHFTAGMLCTELAHMLNPETQNTVFIAAMAGLADRTKSSALDQFITLAQADGYNHEQLVQMGLVMDYLAYMLRNMESRELVNDMFGGDREIQSKLCALLYPKIVALYDQNLALAKTYGLRKQVGETVLQFLDVENTFSRSSYPPAGKTTGLYHDLCVASNQKVVTVGYGSDFVTIRATDAAPFELHSVLERMRRELPDAFAEGGGHQKAGSIKFAPGAKQSVLDFIEKCIREAS